jgi:hypothetical protein
MHKLKSEHWRLRDQIMPWPKMAIKEYYNNPTKSRKIVLPKFFDIPGGIEAKGTENEKVLTRITEATNKVDVTGE